mmetsp:Transcript_27513/g.50780  ORF Transcript_27513/g.50780 Transcript_27513/m.50780 type:complete len:441 (-) Transcript_27513:66-1388(-)
MDSGEDLTNRRAPFFIPPHTNDISICQYPMETSLKILRQCHSPYLDPVVATRVLHPLLLEIIRRYDIEKILFDALLTLGWSAEGFQRRVDTDDLRMMLQKFKYERIAPLGTGAYGVVFKARNRETGEFIAVKKLQKNRGGDVADSTLREISSLRELDHPNVVKLLDVVSSPKGSHVFLILECLHCDLHSWILSHRQASLPSSALTPSSVAAAASTVVASAAMTTFIPLEDIKSIIYQILGAMRHAHSNGIMHRDLKPQNILMSYISHSPSSPSSSSPSVPSASPSIPSTPPSIPSASHASPPLLVKLSDFGLSRSFAPFTHVYSGGVVTLFYRSPELLLGGRNYSSAIDLWSIGCIMAELLAGGRPIFPAASEVQMVQAILVKLGKPPPKLWRKLCANYPALNLISRVIGGGGGGRFGHGGGGEREREREKRAGLTARVW